MEEENKLYLYNGQEVKLKNPGTDGIEDFIKIIGELNFSQPDYTGKTKEEIQKLEQESTSRMFNGMTDTGRRSVSKLIKLTLKKTFGEITEEIDTWAMENFIPLFIEIIKMCIPKNRNLERKEEIINKINSLKEK